MEPKGEIQFFMTMQSSGKENWCPNDVGEALLHEARLMVDGLRVETVLMRHGNRTTACVSSQVGCAMG